MPANLKAPFAESCCDGGWAAVNENSAQLCGCDKGAKHRCERHQLVMDMLCKLINDGIAKSEEGWQEELAQIMWDVVRKLEK